MSTTSTGFSTDATASQEAFCGPSGSGITVSLRKTPTERLTAEQQRIVTEFEPLLKSVVKKVIDYINSSRATNLKTADTEDIFADARLFLCDRARYAQIDEPAASYFSECFKFFGLFQFDKYKKGSKKRRRLKSINAVAVEELEQATAYESQRQAADFIDDLGCPYPDIVRRLYIDNEKVRSVFPDKKDYRYWLQQQKPEVERHLRRMFPEYANRG